MFPSNPRTRRTIQGQTRPDARTYGGYLVISISYRYPKPKRLEDEFTTQNLR